MRRSNSTDRKHFAMRVSEEFYGKLARLRRVEPDDVDVDNSEMVRRLVDRAIVRLDRAAAKK